MSIQEKLNIEIKESLRNKDSFKLNVLKYIKSLLQNNDLESISKPELEILLNHHKKMSKSLVYYSGIALENLKKEISIIESFLPKPTSDEEITEIVDRYIHLANIGEIVKAVKKDISGSFEGKRIISIIKSKLS